MFPALFPDEDEFLHPDVPSKLLAIVKAIHDMTPDEFFEGDLSDWEWYNSSEREPSDGVHPVVELYDFCQGYFDCEHDIEDQHRCCNTYQWVDDVICQYIRYWTILYKIIDDAGFHQYAVQCWMEHWAEPDE